MVMTSEELFLAWINKMISDKSIREKDFNSSNLGYGGHVYFLYNNGRYMEVVFNSEGFCSSITYYYPFE